MIRFSSPATADVMMFEAHGKALIGMMGHLWSASGAIAADDVPAALAALRQALADPRHAAPEADAAADPDEEDKPGVDLQRRAFPLIHLLELAASRKAPVLWRG